MNEFEMLVKTVEAAKAAALASAAALEAVELMLGGSATSEVEEEPEQELDPIEPEPEPEGCDHREGVDIEVGSGKFRVCPCGWQGQLDAPPIVE
jgi:hypothetical protein